MSFKEKKIPGSPFDLITFQLCPGDVDRYFIVDEDFQRKTRKSSPMIRGIQRTLEERRSLPLPICICRHGEGPRFICVDGKHRLYALAQLTRNIRCTIHALLYKTDSYEEIVWLFQTLNLGVPPSINHLIRLDYQYDDPGYSRIMERLPFETYVFGVESGRHGKLTINRAIKWLACAFGDLESFQRYTKREVVEQITDRHVDVLGEFGLIFAESIDPVDAKGKHVKSGMFEVLFRIYVQNRHLGIPMDSWVSRIKTMMLAPAMRQWGEAPKQALKYRDGARIFANALHVPHTKKIKFVPTRRPSIDDVWPLEEAANRKAS